jgi:copper chaperone
VRKIIIIAIATMAILALVAAFAFAGSNCGASAKQASDSKATCSLSKTDAKLTSAATCTAAEKEACAAKLGISAEECADLCKSGSLTMVNMSVKGMTCGGCESDVKTALQAVPGVVNVSKVCYKSGSASVYLDTRKGKSDAVVSAVTNKGYQVEIIPAVATTTTDIKEASPHTCSIETCSVKDKAACGASAKKTSTTIKANADGTQ